MRARAEVYETPLASHGGPPPGEAGPEVRIDASVCLNAYGPAPEIEAAVRGAPIDRYPEPDAGEARRALVRELGCVPEEIAVGAGAAELIQAVAFAWLRPGDAVAAPTPGFGEYERVTRLCGGGWIPAPCREESLRLDLAGVGALVRSRPVRLVFLCAPNNPTGERIPLEAVRTLADTCERRGALLVLDQAYDAFLETPLGTPALHHHPAVLHLRSLTKDHALPGARVAVAVGPPAVIEALERARPPWPVSAGALAAVEAIARGAGRDHLARTLPRLREERGRIESVLSGRGIRLVPSDTHYLMAETGDAAGVSKRLLREHRIRVRDCTSFGHAGHVRIAARTPEENDVLIHALTTVLDTRR